ncbi:TPA: MFS transporter [Burkholderia cepacia]|uniref:MFS transporter n=1 Tax=Burkholderia cepacia TaxID=292 RepID=UPI000D2F2717|nr:MFS transporter [Burkholderia cepacia]MCA8357559.1 MFS transporter [Burkholderia cepacia]HDR9761119.1 MFS transporter [Burkholderia cepacia ATCC 25416]HDV6368330.1 MFS transporter [Burkholderia cepacia]
MSKGSDVIDVRRLIDARRISATQWFIVLVGLLIVAIDGFDVMTAPYSIPALSSTWGVAKAALSPALTASLAGMVIGSLIAGPLGDRIGPKKVLVGALLIFGALSLCCIFAASLTSFVLLRLFVGLGLGAALPNATALVHGYVPARHRSFLISTMYGCGAMIGVAICGFVAAGLITGYGWRSLFIVGGVLPIILAVIVMVGVPESIDFMVLRNRPRTRIAAVLQRVAPDLQFGDVNFVLKEDPTTPQTSGVSVVLARRLRTGTLMLWICQFTSLTASYCITSWMPTMMQGVGFTMHQAGIVAGLYAFGGAIGSPVIGWLMDRFEANAVMAFSNALSAVLVWTIGARVGGYEGLAIITFAAGFFLLGSQCSMPTLATAFYPTRGRAAGVAWMLGLGRFGGIFGAYVGGLLLAERFSFNIFFAVAAVPMLIASSALLVKRAVAQRTSTAKIKTNIA